MSRDDPRHDGHENGDGADRARPSQRRWILVGVLGVASVTGAVLAVQQRLAKRETRAAAHESAVRGSFSLDEVPGAQHRADRSSEQGRTEAELTTALPQARGNGRAKPRPVDLAGELRGDWTAGQVQRPRVTSSVGASTSERGVVTGSADLPAPGTRNPPGRQTGLAYSRNQHQEPLRVAMRSRAPAYRVPAPAVAPEAPTTPKELPGHAAAAERHEPTSTRLPEDQADISWAPRFRLVKCELFNAVESSQLGTPVIGIVMDDVWWNGRLVLPAGTEAHTRATADDERDRIHTDGTITFVLPPVDGEMNGRELTVRGLLLDRDDVTGEGRTFGRTDGSAGLRGTLLKGKNYSQAELRLFAATFLRAAADAAPAVLADREPASGLPALVGARQRSATWRNAGLGAAGEGTSAVLSRYAQQIEQELERHGSYLHVPAGKQFYIYVQDPLRPDRAVGPDPAS